MDKRTRGWQLVGLCYLKGIMLAKDTKKTTMYVIVAKDVKLKRMEFGNQFCLT